MLEMEALLLDLLQHRAVLPEFARDASYAERDELLLRKPLAVLNNTLTKTRLRRNNPMSASAECSHYRPPHPMGRPSSITS
jgi:hypothetical protein